MPEPIQPKLFRVFDAALNRATEGFRVIEDISRFYLDDAELTGLLKIARHDLVQIVEKRLPAGFQNYRNTPEDVGCNIEAPGEYDRGPLQKISDDEPFETNLHEIAPLLEANFRRAQQALRTLEELAKLPSLSLGNDELAHTIEGIRYQAYTLQSETENRLRRPRYDSPSIYVLLDGLDWQEACPVDFDSDQAPERWSAAMQTSRFAQAIRCLVKAEVDFVQLRDKQLSDRQLIAAGKLAKQITQGTQLKLIMNDRIDLALLVNADGVHFGQEELSIAEARRIAGNGLQIGISTHNVDQAKQAVLDGADYIGIGPVFPSSTKPFDEYVGCEMVEQVIRAVNIPAFAIGGIDLTNAAQVASAGCQRIAVSGVFSKLNPNDPDAWCVVAEQLGKLLNPEQHSV